MTANDPAFPHPSGAQGCDGLTKREYAAIAILAAGMAQAEGLGEISDQVRANIFKLAVAIAYEAADALLSAGEEG